MLLIFFEQLSDLKAQLSQLRAELAEKDKALSAARTAAHSTNINAQEVVPIIISVIDAIYDMFRYLVK